VVAQHVRLEIRFPGDYFRAEKLYGFTGEIHQDHISVNFNDIFSEEKKAVLLKLAAQTPVTGDFELSATLHYDNATENFAHVEESIQARVQLTREEADVVGGLQPAVVEQTALFVSNEMYEQAVNLADSRDFEGAMNMIREIKTYLEKYLRTLLFNKELMRQYKEILRYENELPAISRMTGAQLRMAQKLSRSENYLLRKKKP
jgi:Ca-activated chloride channel family protein